MVECQLIVSNARGIHTRPATRIAQLVAQYQAEVTFYKGDEQADGRSIIALLLLAASHGESLRVVAQGAEAEAVLQALGQLFADQLGDGEGVP